MAGYPGVLDDIQRLFPAARITSGYRGPNNPLTRRNPSSAHTHGSPTNPGAVDVAPIPGVGFNDYVSRLKAAGIPVTGARDEQAHPVAWTTGPNWHVSLDTTAPRVSATSPYYKPAQDTDMATRARNFSVALPQSDEPSFGDSPLASNTDYSSSILPNLPALKGKSNTGDIIRTIIGALSDGALAYSGMAPMFAPAENQRQSDDRQMAFDREKLAATIDARREALLHKPPTQTEQFLNEYLDPRTDPQRKAILKQLLMRPIAVPTYGADGSQSMQFYYPDSLPGAQGGEDDWEYSN